MADGCNIVALGRPDLCIGLDPLGGTSSERIGQQSVRVSYQGLGIRPKLQALCDCEIRQTEEFRLRNRSAAQDSFGQPGPPDDQRAAGKRTFVEAEALAAA